MAVPLATGLMQSASEKLGGMVLRPHALQAVERLKARDAEAAGKVLSDFQTALARVRQRSR